MTLLRVARRPVIWLIVLALGLTACGGSNASPEATASTGQVEISTSSTNTNSALSGNLTVFAAASLTDAFTDMGKTLRGENPNAQFTWNFAGSQALVTQLTQGAGADVFASANVTQMNAARDAGVIVGDPIVFARNRLAIVVPHDNPANIQTPADLAKSGVKLVIANAAVPVGDYTRTMLDKMSADPQFGADFRTHVEHNVVSEENNVRQVVTKVQLGEADAGIVYVTDISPDMRAAVTIISVPDAYNVIAEYPIAVVKGGNEVAARAFIQYLLSDAGQAILAQYGFSR